MLWGQSYVLPMTWGGGGIWGAPFGRHAALRLFHYFNWGTISNRGTPLFLKGNKLITT